MTAWRGRYACNFQVSDLEQFASGIGSMMESASTATLISTDGYLDLTLTGHALGHVMVSGEAWDTPRTGAHLSFNFELDQAYLPPLMASVRELVQQLVADQAG